MPGRDNVDSEGSSEFESDSTSEDCSHKLRSPSSVTESESDGSKSDRSVKSSGPGKADRVAKDTLKPQVPVLGLTALPSTAEQPLLQSARPNLFRETRKPLQGTENTFSRVPGKPPSLKLPPVKSESSTQASGSRTQRAAHSRDKLTVLNLDLLAEGVHIAAKQLASGPGKFGRGAAGAHLREEVATCFGVDVETVKLFELREVPDAVDLATCSSHFAAQIQGSGFSIQQVDQHIEQADKSEAERCMLEEKLEALKASSSAETRRLKAENDSLKAKILELKADREQSISSAATSCNLDSGSKGSAPKQLTHKCPDGRHQGSQASGTVHLRKENGTQDIVLGEKNTAQVSREMSTMIQKLEQLEKDNGHLRRTLATSKLVNGEARLALQALKAEVNFLSNHPLLTATKNELRSSDSALADCSGSPTTGDCVDGQAHIHVPDRESRLISSIQSLCTEQNVNILEKMARMLKESSSGMNIHLQ